MAVKLNSTGGGSVTLDSPSTASNYTVTLPSAAGTLATTTGTGSVFTNPTINGFTGDTSAITIGTTQFVKDASGNIGIGTSSPGAASGYTTLDVSNATNGARIRCLVGSTAYGGMYTNGTTDFRIGSLAAVPLNIITGSNTIATFDTSGNLGLGVTPSGWSSLARAFSLGSSGSGIQGSIANSGATNAISLTSNAYYNAGWKYIYSGGGYSAGRYDIEGGQHSWYTATSGTAGNAISFTQAMTLDASGNFFLGTTSYLDVNCRANIQQDSNNVALEIYCTNASLAAPAFIVKTARNTTNASYKAIDYYNNGAAADRFYVIDSGAIYSTSTSITGISDVRHKENIRDLDTGLSAVLALKPRRFDWKEGKGIDRKDQPGFIAQEVEKVLPELIELWTESQEDKNEYKGIRLADMIPTLVKAIQELSAQNNALEARLAQLEAK